MILASFAVLGLLAAAAPVQHLGKDPRALLHGALLDAYDASNGGFEAGEKRVELAPLEAAASLSREGDHRFDEVLAKTLDSGLKLLDPAGGIFRASKKPDWTSPRKEKPAGAEAEALLAYALGYSFTHSAHYLAAARSISAQLAKSPPVDPLEVAQAMRALAALHDATGDEQALARALKLGGAFRESASLRETVAFGRAWLALYRSTADRRELQLAAALARAAEAIPLQPGDFEENARLARFANLLAQHTGDPRDAKLAERAFQLAAQGLGKLPMQPELIAADLELSSDPLHMTVVGPKEDAAPRVLFAAALKAPAIYSRIEWWDPKEGPLPNPDIPLPQTGRAAAYSCSNGVCSLPLHDPAKLAAHF